MSDNLWFFFMSVSYGLQNLIKKIGYDWITKFMFIYSLVCLLTELDFLNAEFHRKIVNQISNRKQNHGHWTYQKSIFACERRNLGV